MESFNFNNGIKFAHMADCHIGGWRDPRLKRVNSLAFKKAIDICIDRKVDFVIISGDLFNTAIPSIDSLKEVTKELKQLKDNEMQVYIVPGSHDFSSSGKTIIDVLENAGLVINVVKGTVQDGKLRLDFTQDIKSKAQITGILGRKGTLEKSYYENLDREYLENQLGKFNIFIFHTALSEFKPSYLGDMEAQPLSLLPKGFDYYAGGHVHYVFSKTESDYGLIAYPGPIFPNNFSELERLHHGGFYIFDSRKPLEFVPLKIYDTVHIKKNCDHKTPEQITEELIKHISDSELKEKIITIRLMGTIESGKVSDIDFTRIFNLIYDKGAYFVAKNLSKLKSREYEEVNVSAGDVDEIEKAVIEEGLDKIKVNRFKSDDEKKIANKLLEVLSIQKQDGETKTDYESRIGNDLDVLLGLIE